MNKFKRVNFNDQRRISLHNRLLIFLFIFQFLGISLAIIYNLKIQMTSIYLAYTFILVTTIINYFIPKFINGDATFIYLVNMLYSISLINIIRLDYTLINKHIIWYFAGFIVFILIRYFIKYFNKFLQDKFILFFAITILTFIATLLFGFSKYGAKNWINVGGLFTLQLSEFAKISYIFMIAAYYNNYKEYENHRFGKYYLAGASYIFAGLFFLQGELGTAMVFFALMLASMLIFEKRYAFIILNIALAFIGVYLASLVLSHIKVRIDIWLNPWDDFNGKGYQIIQSLYAIANGGFFGTGIGLGSPSLVPVIQTDFIMTAILEEMGLFMGFSIILIFILIFYKSMKVSLQFKANYLSSLALSIGLLFSMQTIIMLAGIMKLMPLTGITTPFLSYGGSSTTSSFILLAVLHYLTSKTGEEYEG